MATTDNPMAAHLPAQFLAYKQKAEEQANKGGPRMGNTNCWGSFSFMTADPRTSVSSGIGNGTDNGFGSERSYGSSPTNQQERRSSGLALENVQQIGVMWNKFSGTIKSTVTGIDAKDETHSAELGSRKSLPTNKQMTNVDRLKSMAAASVTKHEIPDPPAVPEQPAFQKQSSFTSFPSLASSRSDGSSSMESSTGSGRLFSMGSKFFGRSDSKIKKVTAIGSHTDPSIGELKKDKAAASSFFPAIGITKKVEEKKNIDIEKLKKLRDQAAGLVPPSPSAAKPEEKEEEKMETLESQIDDLEKEMGLTSTPATPPRLRMDGFDDVHETEQRFAEIKVTPQAVSHLDPYDVPKKMPSPLSQIGNSPQKTMGPGGLSTAL